MINIILVGVACLILGFIIGWFSYKTKIIEISDEKPVDESFISNAMKLSNELKDYIYEKDGKLYLKVVKGK